MLDETRTKCQLKAFKLPLLHVSLHTLFNLLCFYCWLLLFKHHWCFHGCFLKLSSGFCTVCECFLSLWAAGHSSTEQSLSVQQRRSSGGIFSCLHHYLLRDVMYFQRKPSLEAEEMIWVVVDTSRVLLFCQSIYKRE